MENRYIKEPGRLAKNNTSCNCWLCSPEKKVGNSKKMLSKRERIEQLRMNDD